MLDRRWQRRVSQRGAHLPPLSAHECAHDLRVPGYTCPAMSSASSGNRNPQRAVPRGRRGRRRRHAVLLAAAGVIVAIVLAWTAIGARGAATHHRDATAQRTAGVAARAAQNPRAVIAPSTTVVIADVGDTMMGSPPWGLPPAGGRYLLSAVTKDLVGNVVTGNLEGTLTGYTGTSKCGAPTTTTCFAFRSPPGYAANLRRAGFTVVNGANNHSHDFGAAGQANTAAALRHVGILYTGPPGTIAIEHVGSTKVAILGFAPYSWANNSLNLAGVAALVRKAAHEANLVIVHVHAGAEGIGAQHVRTGSEYYLGENRGNVLAFAHTAIDAGADLVVGSGPHVLRGMQFWHGHLIAYSMGNFVGYKAFGLGGVLSQSAVLQVTLKANGQFVSGRLRPIHLSSLGVPSAGGSGIPDVRALSREDFGATAARIAASGMISPPPGQ
jgi:Bacterial capsule synthesis protein PGA_cap